MSPARTETITPSRLAGSAVEDALQARWEATWDAMASAGLSALVVAGRGVISHYGYLQYIGGYVPVIREGYAVIRTGEKPVLVLPTTADAHEAHEATGLDVRVAAAGALITEGDDFAGIVASLVGPPDRSPRVGIVGLAALVSAGDGQRLRAALANHDVVDATALLAEVKMLKDAYDIRQLEATAALVDAGYRTLIEAIRPGAVPTELAGRAQGTVRALGARDALVFVSAGAFVPVSPSDRALRPGDLVSGLVELAGPGGYWAEFGGLFAIGELDAEREQLAQAAIDASHAARSLLRPGVPVARVAAAIDEHAARVDARSGIWHGHGVGVDHDLPLVGHRDPHALQTGMVLAVHPNFTDRTTRFGAMVTDTYVIEEPSARRLSGLDQELRRIAT